MQELRHIQGASLSWQTLSKNPISISSAFSFRRFPQSLYTLHRMSARRIFHPLLQSGHAVQQKSRSLPVLFCIHRACRIRRGAKDNGLRTFSQNGFKIGCARFKSAFCVRVNVNRFPPPKKQALHKRQNKARESALLLRDQGSP